MLEVTISEISITQLGFSVLLKPENEKKVVPIFIGPFETFSISSALEKKKIERPITHDLTKSIIESLNATIEKVVINSFKMGTFYARLYLKYKSSKDNKSLVTINLDSRPSDAIALAIRFNAPLFIEEEVYESTSIDINLLNQKSQETEASEDLFLDELLEFSEEEIKKSKSNKKKKADSKSTTSKKTNKPKLLSQSDVLQQMLKTALKKEDYQEAAQLRDEIRSLETKNKKK